jgi:hypothetical protein
MKWRMGYYRDKQDILVRLSKENKDGLNYYYYYYYYYHHHHHHHHAAPSGRAV